MSQQIDAIYDDGVFKPLTPLSLPHKARVRLTVDAQTSTISELDSKDATTPETDAEVLARQKAALEELRKRIDRIPQFSNNDGWSVRQHDELLYGWKK